MSAPSRRAGYAVTTSSGTTSLVVCDVSQPFLTVKGPASAPGVFILDVEATMSNGIDLGWARKRVAAVVSGGSILHWALVSAETGGQRDGADLAVSATSTTITFGALHGGDAGGPQAWNAALVVDRLDGAL